MVPFILAILVALFPPVHVLRCECISTTVTKSVIVESTFEVIGAKGRFDPFQVKYLRPTRSSRGAPDLLTHPPFQPWEEAFWIVIDHGKGKLEAVVSPTKAREYLPDLQKLTRSLNPETLKNGVQTQESQELNYVGRLAALVSATIEPEMRDRLPEILVRYRESEEPILREFVRWYDSRPLKGPMFAQRVEEPAAPVPKGSDKPVLYYPTSVGTKRVYQWSGGVEFTTVVTESKLKDGVRLVTVMIHGKDGQLNPLEVVAVSEKDVSGLVVGSNGYTPGLCWLKFPAKAGDSWKTGILPEYPGGSGAVAGLMTIRGVEKIKVHAGTFEALHLEGQGQDTAGKVIVEHRWYAPRVGLVKCVNGAGDVLMLKSYKPAEE